MGKVYIGIDNGVTGSMAFLFPERSLPILVATPTKREQDYTKKKQKITRLHGEAFGAEIQKGGEACLAVVERPLVTPKRFRATISAVRCLEAQLCILEIWGVPYLYVDSKQWQKEMLPKGVKTGETKKASLDMGIRLFPSLSDKIKKQGDADALLMAEWARRRNL